MKHKPAHEIQIGSKKIGWDHPTYFIADVAANHDGDLERAKDLIYLAAENGADAAKFQHFKAETIVSDYGFKNMGNQQSHQSKWKKSVFEVYQDASVNVEWTSTLKETCDKAGITFFTSPYSMELVDAVNSYVPAFKVGSGDITWLEIIEHMAQKGKPMLVATGASTADEVAQVVDHVLGITGDLALMQCNTNYTGSLENFKYIQLNVLKSYASMFPGLILGLSDHTPGHATVLGSIALGARVIEKHFTDDTKREGPDHPFSMDPKAWKDMVERSRELEISLGSGVKKVEKNEEETVVIQRRSLRTVRDLNAGSILTREDIIPLRPCPADGISPLDTPVVIGKTLVNELKGGEHIRWRDLK